MSRPRKKRTICGERQDYLLKPCAKGQKCKGRVELSGDEVEALRLCDLMGEYHDEAAKKMKISRATFGRIVESARKKVSDAIINGKEIKISCCGPVEYT